MEGRLRFNVDVGELAEDPDDAMALVEADGADLDRHAFAVLVDQDDGAVDVFVADHVLREGFPGAPRFLGRDHGRHLAATDVSDQRSRGGIEPADDLVFVDDVAWNIHALEGARNVTANCMQSRHPCDSAVKRTATHRPFWAIFQNEVRQSGVAGLRYGLPVGFAGLEDIFAAIDFVPNRTERLLLDPGLQLTKEHGEIAGPLS